METISKQAERAVQNEIERQNQWILSYRFELNEKTELLENLIGMQRRLKERINVDGNAHGDYRTIASALAFMRQSLSIERHSQWGLEIASKIANENVYDLNGLHEVEILDKRKDEFYERAEYLIDRSGNAL